MSVTQDNCLKLFLFSSMQNMESACAWVVEVGHWVISLLQNRFNSRAQEQLPDLFKGEYRSREKHGV